MEALKDLYNMYVNHDRTEESKEWTEARDKLEQVLGDSFAGEVEDIAGSIGYFACEQGFCEGFRYAAALLVGGKVVHEL